MPILNSMESSINTGNKTSDSPPDSRESPCLTHYLLTAPGKPTQSGLEPSKFLSPMPTPVCLLQQQRDLAFIQVFAQKYRSREPSWWLWTTYLRSCDEMLTTPCICFGPFTEVSVIIHQRLFLADNHQGAIIKSIICFSP